MQTLSGLPRGNYCRGYRSYFARRRIVNTNEFIFNKGKDVPETELLRMFVLRYYDSTESIPHELIVEQVPEDAEVIESWLTEKLASNHGAKVHFTVPQRGEKNALMAMANKNARHVLMRYKARSSYDDDRINAALLQLESALALDAPPLRIECFDISIHPWSSFGGVNGGIH